MCLFVFEELELVCGTYYLTEDTTIDDNEELKHYYSPLIDKYISVYEEPVWVSEDGLVFLWLDKDKNGILFSLYDNEPVILYYAYDSNYYKESFIALDTWARENGDDPYDILSIIDKIGNVDGI